jgi:hypothetical protein
MLFDRYLMLVATVELRNSFGKHIDVGVHNTIISR